MVRKLFLSLGLASLVVSGAFACIPGGCTPGFWKQKQHFEQWKVNRPGNSYAAVFQVDSSSVDPMVSDVNGKAYDNFKEIVEDKRLELGEALWLKGKGNKLNQLVRASTASYLNLRAGLGLTVDIGGIPIELAGGTGMSILRNLVQAAFLGSPLVDVEELKDALDEANNAGCPLN